MKEGFAELGSVAEFINGAAFKPEDWGNEGKRIIRIQNLTDTTKPFNRTNREVAKKLHVNPGDLLVSWSATLGVFEWNEPEVALLNQHIFRVVPNEVRVEKRYLRHGLEGALLEMQRHLHGATMQHVNRGEFLATKLYLPPLAEQRRIAEVLDKAEALRAKRRAALAQLDSLTQSLFLDLFGDPVTNPKGWERVQLGQMVERITKGESPGWQGFDYQADGALFVTSENVRLGAIDLSAPKFIPLEFNRKLFRSELRQGDLLINLVGASIGRSCIFPGYDCPANINQAVAVVTVNFSRLENSFLSGLLTSERGQWLLLNNRVEGARANISLTDLRELNLPLPPLDLQREFARRIAAVEKLKTAQRAALAELDALFASLQHRAFRGEL